MPDTEKNNHEQIIETLADMNQAMGTRFDHVDQEIGELRGDMDRQFKGVYEEFRGVHDRLNRIENILLQDLQRRVEALEQRIGIK